MAHLLDTMDDEVPITYGQFMLRGVSGLQGVDTRVHLAELDRQVYLYASAEHSRVRLEVWDAPPPPWEGHGKLVADARCVAETGVVAVTPYMSAASGRSVLIGPAFFEYGLHLYAHNAERLLRFWPIRDVFDPALHLRPDGIDADAKPVETAEARSALGDWVSTRVLGSAEPPAPPAPPKAEEDWPLDHEHEVRLAELLGDLRTRLMTRPPTWLLDTDEGNRSRYLNELRSSVAIARRLNPDGLPTFQLSFGELVERPHPGLSYRLWQWRPIVPPADPASLPESGPVSLPESGPVSLAESGPASLTEGEAAGRVTGLEHAGQDSVDREHAGREHAAAFGSAMAATGRPESATPGTAHFEPARTVTGHSGTGRAETGRSPAEGAQAESFGTGRTRAEHNGSTATGTAAPGGAVAESATSEPAAPGAPREPETLTAEREVRAQDVLRRRRLVTGIVTVLREENGVVEVRDAVPAEVARVLAAEKAWALD
ncbi:hypothetical protein [Nonomuraea sp. bgisy101]|uniref:hypothetical protein n=1 Tax=Nonomuraea sp. bgisy101 TaxID=3413784 RepID=UPI003D735905